MKLILDFDDTLCDNGPLKENIFLHLEKHGIKRSKEKEYYEEWRTSDKPFSLKEFLSGVFAREKKEINPENLYKEIMNSTFFPLRKELVEEMQKTGKENCYLITSGEQEFQMDKIKKSGAKSFFHEIHIVSNTKKEIIEKICDEYPQEEIIFYDDKENFFSDLDRQRYPNLKTVLYKRS